jgi:serine/threonine protein kinase
VDGPDVELGAGEVFAGWRVERELARGGMGVLYLAHHPRLPRTDVIKVLSPYLSESSRFRDRFLAEANRMSTLSHPHVMPIHDSGTAENGTLYLVMPYIAGGDLRGLLKKVGSLEPRRASRLITQLAAALDAAHRIGVVHRDVKPENVMLSSVEPNDPDHVLLTDFGISREELSATTLTATGELLLTPAYAAPEQALGQPVDARADQYALACILVELLTGQPPYEGDVPVVMLMAHLQEPIPQIAVRFGLAPEIDGVLTKALAKSPGDRYASCRDFALAVRDVLDPSASRTTADNLTPVEPPVATLVTPPPVQSGSPSQPPSQPPSWPTPSLPPFSGQPDPKSRKPVWIWVAAIVVLIGAGVGIALGLSGGSKDKPSGQAGGGVFPSASASASPSSSPSATKTAAPSPAFAALLTRIPTAVVGSCTDTTSQLNSAEKPHVQTRATCSPDLGGHTLTVNYRTMLGNAAAITSYRGNVLGLGGNNHHGGNCLTLQPATGEQIGDVGFAQDLDVNQTPSRIWCSKSASDGTLWDLQNAAPAGSMRIMTEVQTSTAGGVATAQARFDDLEAVAPTK